MAKSYRVTVNEVVMGSDGVDSIVGPIVDIIEFELENPPETGTVFTLLKQLESEEIAFEAAQPMYEGEFDKPSSTLCSNSDADFRDRD